METAINDIKDIKEMRDKLIEADQKSKDLINELMEQRITIGVTLKMCNEALQIYDEKEKRDAE